MRRSRIFLSPPYVGAEERKAVEKAFDSGYVAPCGPMVDEFERRLAKLAGRKHAVAVSSGTAAIDLLMEEYGVDRTWTVIAPTLTFIATVGPAWHRGAKIVFVDSDATGNIDVSLLEQALAANHRNSSTTQPLNTSTPKHLLVLGVDLYGRCCDYAAISALCEKYGAVYVNDSAESVGAKCGGRPSGSAGVAAVYSFNGNKIITTSGGGAIVTDDAGIAARAKKRSQQSREPFPWYQHEEVGYNYRMSNLLASVGLAQLKRLRSILAKRRAHSERYREVLDVLPEVKGENHWLTVALLDSQQSRDRLLARFAKADIEARPVWKPLHLQPVFKGCRTYGGEVAETLFNVGICLPSGTGLTEADFLRILKVI